MLAAHTRDRAVRARAGQAATGKQRGRALTMDARLIIGWPFKFARADAMLYVYSAESYVRTL